MASWSSYHQIRWKLSENEQHQSKWSWRCVFAFGRSVVFMLFLSHKTNRKYCKMKTVTSSTVSQPQSQALSLSRHRRQGKKKREPGIEVVTLFLSSLTLYYTLLLQIIIQNKMVQTSHRWCVSNSNLNVPDARSNFRCNLSRKMINCNWILRETFPQGAVCSGYL